MYHLADGQDPSRPKKSLEQIKTPRVTANRSAFYAVLFTLLMDVQFVEHLHSNHCTRGVHDGARLLYKMLTCLQLAVTRDTRAAVAVITQFVEALLLCHWCRPEDLMELGTCWQIIDGMVPNLLDYFRVRVRKYYECATDDHGNFGEVEYESNVVVVGQGMDWATYNSNAPNQLFVEHDLVQNQLCPVTVERTEQGTRQCNGAPWGELRFLDIVSSNTTPIVMRFKDGLCSELWTEIHKGTVLYFGTKCWAVWGAIFAMPTGHHDICYQIIQTDKRKTAVHNSRCWLQFNSVTGSMILNPKLEKEWLREMILFPPEVTCWCGKANDGAMRTCPRCHLSSHLDCIDIAIDPESKRKWKGDGCRHCSGSLAQ